MEESCEIHSEEDNVLPEKNKKRRFKTPSQVEALEKFYNDHKYPAESMKSQLAEELGLSEKQISGWFCHRRLKDKKVLKDEACENGRQDRLSGVILDHGSGLRQDSCSSTKQGDYRHFDSREVDFQMLYDQDYPAADITSASSSASLDRLFPLSEDPNDMELLRYSSQNSNYMLTNTMGVQKRGYMMGSGYLNLQDEVENAAITAVKRQLGRHYREDGPPLGIEFQLLPPCAFDSPNRDLINEPYYVGDPIVKNFHSIPRVFKEPGLGTRYDKYDSKMHPKGPYLEGAPSRTTMWESDHGDEFSNFPSKQKYSLTNYSDHAPDWNSAVDLDDDSVGEASGFNCSRNCGVRSWHGIKEMKSDSGADHSLRLYGGKVTASESPHTWLNNYNVASPHVFQFESTSVLRHNEFLDTEDKGKSRRMAKFSDEKLYRERRMSKEDRCPVQVNMQPKIIIRMDRRIRGDEFQSQEKSFKTPSSWELLTRTNQIEGSAAHSNDKTSASSSSKD